jgi:hypothetical protein
MKIAEALRERSDLQKELSQLQHRINLSARHYEGEEPQEDPAALLEQVHERLDRLRELIVCINKTNAVTQVESGQTLAELIAWRDILGRRRKLTTEVADAAGGTSDRLSGWGRRRAELREETSLSVPDLRAEADGYAQEWRKLDIIIQQANWAADLVE